MAAIAAECEGVVDVDQLRACGISSQMTYRRVRSGRLHPMHDGVYAVGHSSVSLHGRFVAAAKACRPDASLSHRAAAAREGYMDWGERHIEVTVPRDRYCSHEGIQVHRSSIITRGDCVIRDGVLVTKPTWTLVALAAVLDKEDLRRVLRNAFAARLTGIPSLIAVLKRVGPARGTRVLRDILAHGAVPTRTVLEDVVYDIILSAGFVPPEVNEPMRLEGRRVVPDFRWPDQKLVVEADGSKWHDHPIALAEDAERQALLERHGETVLRVRWEEAVARPGSVEHRLDIGGAPRL